MSSMIVVLGVVAGLIIVIGTLMVLARFYRKVEQGRALIINKVKYEPEVTFTGGLVLPVFHRAELMDISVKTIEIDRRGKGGLICRDNIRADITVTFFVRVNKTKDDVLKVAQMVGCSRASDITTLEQLFQAKFSEALKTVGKRLDFIDLYKERDHFKDQIIEVIGKDLNGYVLDDAAIDYLEQTPVEMLDKENILDAQGIRKITQLTTEQNVMTNSLRQTERKEIKKQNVEAEEAILSLDRQKAEAEAKQIREIQSMQARETAETKRVQSEELLKSELARVKTEEEVAIANEARMRQTEVAAKNRERVVAIETERVEKDRALEQIARERETELKRISKERELELQKKEIADVVRTRIAVDKTVAEEEERIKDLRALAEARRHKDVAVTAAEGVAQESLVKELKRAEAAEQVAKMHAREQLTLAEASLEAADRESRGKVRLAEGLQAEAAAEGLARARVKEAEAVACEKMGLAEAVVIRERLQAEAQGLAEKAEAMKALDGVGREHEEFRLRLEQRQKVQLAEIAARTSIAAAQAEILKEAFAHAKINIVGGDGEFFDRFVKAVAVGQQVEGTLDQSDTLRTLMSEYTEGGRSLPEDIKDVLSRPRLGAESVKNLSVSALIGQLMKGADAPVKAKLASLMTKAEELGVEHVGNHADR